MVNISYLYSQIHNIFDNVFPIPRNSVYRLHASIASVIAQTSLCNNLAEIAVLIKYEKYLLNLNTGEKG